MSHRHYQRLNLIEGQSHACRARNRYPHDPHTQPACFWLHQGYKDGHAIMERRGNSSSLLWLRWGRTKFPAQISSVFRSPQHLCPAFALMLSAQLWIRIPEMWAHGQGWNQTRRTETDHCHCRSSGPRQPKENKRASMQHIQVEGIHFTWGKHDKPSSAVNN